MLQLQGVQGRASTVFDPELRPKGARRSPCPPHLGRRGLRLNSINQSTNQHNLSSLPNEMRSLLFHRGEAYFIGVKYRQISLPNEISVE